MWIIITIVITTVIRIKIKKKNYNYSHYHHILPHVSSMLLLLLLLILLSLFVNIFTIMQEAYFASPPPLSLSLSLPPHTPKKNMFGSPRPPPLPNKALHRYEHRLVQTTQIIESCSNEDWPRSDQILDRMAIAFYSKDGDRSEKNRFHHK